MIKRLFILLPSAFLLFCTAHAAITKKKDPHDKDSAYVYYDSKNSEIAREKIAKDGSSVFSQGAEINGEVRERDEHGKLVFIYNYKDNKKEGRAVGFYPNGKKMYEFNYVAGVLQGIGIKYYQNGNAAEKVFYINGKVEGPAHIYLENGNYYKYTYENNKLNGEAFLYDREHRVLEMATYKDNVLEGESVKYYLSGSVKSEMSYRRGKLEGYAKYYDEKGRETTALLYKNGKEVDKIQYAQDSYGGNFDDPQSVSLKKTGSERIVWQGPAMAHLSDSQRMINEIKFFEKDKTLNGIHRSYHKNGNVKYEGSFSGNRPYGVFKAYSPEGKLIGTDNYRGGKLYGTSKMYYETGEPLAEYSYKNGKLEDISWVKNKDGVKITEAYYKNNLLHGSLTNFYENGQPSFESYFSSGEPVGQLRYYAPDKEHKLLYLIEFKSGGIYKSTAFSKDGAIEFTAEY